MPREVFYLSDSSILFPPIPSSNSIDIDSLYSSVSMAVQTNMADSQMAGQADKIGTATQDDGQIERQISTAGKDEGPFKAAPHMKMDEFGAHAKTDPKEITLVRKLDMRILVCSSPKSSF